MKIIKTLRNQEDKNKFSNSSNFRNTKSSTWNTKRRFAL